MGKLARVYVCVEGKSEINLFSNPLERLFDEYFGDDIEVIINYAYEKQGNVGDFTSYFDIDNLLSNNRKIELSDWNKRKHYEKNKQTKGDPEAQLRNRLCEGLIKCCFKYNKELNGLTSDDFTTVIHLIDLDGCFTKDKKIKPIKEDSEEKLALDILSRRDEEFYKKLDSKNDAGKTILYGDDCIWAMDCSETSERNDRKRRIIEQLIKMDHIEKKKYVKKNSKKKNNDPEVVKSIKYYKFYFSSNLDHFIFGENTIDNYAKLLDRDLTDEDIMNFKGGSANLAVQDKIILNSKVRDKLRNSEKFTDFFTKDKDAFPINYDEEDFDEELKKAYDESWDKVKKSSLKRGTNVNILIEMIKRGNITDWN